MDWMKKLVIDYLLKRLTHDQIAQWADMIKGKILPYLYKKKEELMEELLEEAKKTNTDIDDTLVQALDRFLDAFFPDNEVML